MTSNPSSVLNPPDFLKLLGHEVRWELLTQLAQSDLRVQELVARVGRPINLVSYHLAQLRQGRLVSEHRSTEDGRDVYYCLELERVAELYATSGTALHPALGGSAPLAVTKTSAAPPARVLFLCTHNSARSQMAEALLRRLGPDLQVFSAGTEPAQVHPLALSTLAEMGVDTGDLRSKHLEEFAGQSFDYIITVCDRVRERCPVFPGDPTQIHWSFADPAAVGGTEAAQRHAFAETARQLQTRLNYLLLVLATTPPPAAVANQPGASGR